MRKGFTLLELVFVIVIMGILARFGTELLIKTYENYVYSSTLNRLSSQSEMAVKQIANRLQYRIKDSTIARTTPSSTDIVPIGSTAGNELVLEWIGTDIDGWRGTGAPEWSGFIDLDDSNKTQLSTPGTSNTSGEGVVFFIGSNVDLDANFGWTAGTIGTQDAAIHPMYFTAISGKSYIKPKSGTGDFSSSIGGVYEFYQFAEYAYGVYLDDTTHELYFYYDYKPWDNENMASAEAAGHKQLIMENVSAFTFISLGDILVIQVCTSVTEESEYAICKEKTVF